MEIILIRHGETEGNVINKSDHKVFIGRYNYPLSQQGIDQAKALKNHPLLEGAQHFFVSPLERTRQTASYFCNAPISYDERITERSLGIFESHYVDEIKADPKYDDYFNGPLKGFDHHFENKAPEGESYSDVCARVANFLDELKTMDYEKVVVVSHFCTIRCFLVEAGLVSKEDVLKQRIYSCDPIVIHI